MQQPRNLDLLAHLRRQNFMPSTTVVVRINVTLPRTEIYSDMPLDIEIGIPDGQPIAGIDLRPLRELSVAIDGMNGTPEQVRELAIAVVNARPCYLSGTTPDGKIFEWHPDRGWDSTNVD